MSNEPGDGKRLALALGYFGLAPFVIGAIATLLPVDPGIRQFVYKGLLLYSAIILSFMGGIHWGLALSKGTDRARRYLLSVVPAVLAWAVLLLLPMPMALAILGGSHMAQWFADRQILAGLAMPSWYLGLRPRLTYTVATCHLVALYGLSLH